MYSNSDHFSNESKPLLKFVVCGGRDDGTSELVDRLLCVSKKPSEDQVSVSQSYGFQDDDPRFFSADQRDFAVTHISGQDDRLLNLVTETGAVSLALLVVDARKGLTDRTLHNSLLFSLFGIDHIVIAVSNMDTLDDAESVFYKICDDYRESTDHLERKSLQCIPISSLGGGNILKKSELMTWYQGPALVAYLDTIEVDCEKSFRFPFRFPVESAKSLSLGLFGCEGMISGGRISVGELVRIQPSGREHRVARIIAPMGDTSEARFGQLVTLVLEDAATISSGEMISSAKEPAEVADQFEVTLAWLDKEPMLPGRRYLLKLGTTTVNARVTHIKYRIDIRTRERLAAQKMEHHAIAVCNISIDQPVTFDPYRINPKTGGFLLKHLVSNKVLGAGMIHFALRRSQNIHLQSFDVDKVSRALIKGHKPCALWFTGLSGSGKSSVANTVERKLYERGHHTYVLDGDNIRHGLNKDLGFTDEARVENIRRVAEVTKLMIDAGLIVITAFISPFRAERKMARSLIEPGEFLLIHMDTPLDVAEKRDVKGLYKKARRGELKNFTGIDSPYERPDEAEITLIAGTGSIDEMADRVIAFMEASAIIPKVR